MKNKSTNLSLCVCFLDSIGTEPLNKEKAYSISGGGGISHQRAFVDTYPTKPLLVVVGAFASMIALCLIISSIAQCCNNNPPNRPAPTLILQFFFMGQARRDALLNPECLAAGV